MRKNKILKLALWALVAGGAALSPAALWAKVEQIAVPADETYFQASSGAGFPPQIAGFTRTAVRKFGSEDDVSAAYEDRGTKSWASVYVTRVAQPDASLWFNRVSEVVLAREGFAPDSNAVPKSSFFIAPKFGRPSGLTLAYPTRGGSVKASGIRIAAYKDFIVKLRVSSEQKSPDEINDIMDDIMAGLNLPAPSGNEPAPYNVASCKDTLAFDNAAQKLSQNGSDVNGPALQAALQTQSEKAPTMPSADQQYCRDDEAAPAGSKIAIYRAGGSRAAYLIAPDDTGTTIAIGNSWKAMPRKAESSEYPLYLNAPSETLFFGSFAGLPRPETAMTNLKVSNLLAVLDRKGKIIIRPKDKP